MEVKKLQGEELTDHSGSEEHTSYGRITAKPTRAAAVHPARCILVIASRWRRCVLLRAPPALPSAQSQHADEPIDLRELRLRARSLLRIRAQDAQIRAQVEALETQQRFKAELLSLIVHDPLRGFVNKLDDGTVIGLVRPTSCSEQWAKGKATEADAEVSSLMQFTAEEEDAAEGLRAPAEQLARAVADPHQVRRQVVVALALDLARERLLQIKLHRLVRREQPRRRPGRGGRAMCHSRYWPSAAA